MSTSTNCLFYICQSLERGIFHVILCCIVGSRVLWGQIFILDISGYCGVKSLFLTFQIDQCKLFHEPTSTNTISICILSRNLPWKWTKRNFSWSGRSAEFLSPSGSISGIIWSALFSVRVNDQPFSFSALHAERESLWIHASF